MAVSEDRKSPIRDVALGRRIREARHRAGLTQTQLGDRVGVSQRSVSAWEAHGVIPNDIRRIERAVKAPLLDDQHETVAKADENGGIVSIRLGTSVLAGMGQAELEEVATAARLAAIRAAAEIRRRGERSPEQI
jgi:transcriptional regulator with XRE-family HTH domain